MKKAAMATVLAAVVLCSGGCAMLGGEGMSGAGQIKAIGPDVEHDGTEILFDNGFGLIVPIKELPAQVGEFLKLDGEEATITPAPAPEEKVVNVGVSDD